MFLTELTDWTGNLYTFQFFKTEKKQNGKIKIKEIQSTADLQCINSLKKQNGGDRPFFKQSNPFDLLFMPDSDWLESHSFIILVYNLVRYIIKERKFTNKNLVSRVNQKGYSVCKKVFLLQWKGLFFDILVKKKKNKTITLK